MLSVTIFPNISFQNTTRKQKKLVAFHTIFLCGIESRRVLKTGQASDCDMARYHEQLHETHHYQIHSLMPAENNDRTIRKEKKI